MSLNPHTCVKDYQTYLLDFKSSPPNFSGSCLYKIIDSFATILLTHLSEEIPTSLSLGKFRDKINMDKIWEKDRRAVVGMLDKTAGLAFFFLNCDTTFEGGKWAAFLPIPQPIRWVFTHICTWPNRAYCNITNYSSVTCHKGYLMCRNVSLVTSHQPK